MTTLIDVRHPTINLLKSADNGHGTGCRILEIKNQDDNTVQLHFDTPEDCKAFMGMVGLMQEDI